MEQRALGGGLPCQRRRPGADRAPIQQAGRRGAGGKRACFVEKSDRQAPGDHRNKILMQLQLSSWPEVEAYLARSKAILIPIGSTEQHGPNGLLGTDALCPEVIGRRAGDEAGILVGPTFNVGQAQHHMAFPGTITLRPSTMIAAMMDWGQSLTRHGFERIYWLNGHGGNIATITAAFSEMYHGITFDRAGSNHAPLRCHLRNWWELSGVMDLCRQLFPVGEGSHATPSEVSVTWFGYPEAQKQAAM